MFAAYPWRFGNLFWCLWILTTNMPAFVSSWLDYYCYIFTHFEQSKAAVAIETAVEKLDNPISMHNFLLFVFISLVTSLKIVIKMHAIGGKKWGCVLGKMQHKPFYHSIKITCRHLSNLNWFETNFLMPKQFSFELDLLSRKFKLMLNFLGYNSTFTVVLKSNFDDR